MYKIICTCYYLKSDAVIAVKDNMARTIKKTHTKLKRQLRTCTSINWVTQINKWALDLTLAITFHTLRCGHVSLSYSFRCIMWSCHILCHILLGEVMWSCRHKWRTTCQALRGVRRQLLWGTEQFGSLCKSASFAHWDRRGCWCSQVRTNWSIHIHTCIYSNKKTQFKFESWQMSHCT